MKIDSEEISEYIKSVLEGIQSLPDEKAISSPIKFRLSLSSTIEGEAGVKLFVASAGGTKSQQKDAEVEFEIDDKKNIHAKLLERFLGMSEILARIS